MKTFTLNAWLVPLSENYLKRRRELIEYLKGKNYDLIFLQEVWCSWDYYLLKKELPEYKFITANFPYPFNQSGLVILHKGKLQNKKFVEFYLTNWPSFRELVAQKGFLFAEIEFRGKIYSCLNTHLMNFNLKEAYDVNKKRLIQIGEFMKEKENALVIGDFNFPYEEIDMLIPFNKVNTGFTFPLKKKKLDYIFYKDIKVKKLKLVKGLSDHYGIEIEF